MKRTFCFLLLCSLPAFGLKNRERTYRESCDDVWTAAVAVGKTQDYRIVGISKDEHLLSLALGGFWAGERLITLTLSPGVEGGCLGSVQSRFSGLAHSDGPELLIRVAVELVAEKVDRKSESFKHYKTCMEWLSKPEAKCDERLHKELADDKEYSGSMDDWWKATKP